MVEQSEYREYIILTGYISAAEKSFLLKKAKCFLYPSLYEGFGIPVLEAFDANTPVITANNSSLPEVGGDAALYIETADVDGLSEQMYKVMNMSEKDRESLSKRMNRQLGKFSWEKCAEETMREILE